MNFIHRWIQPSVVLTRKYICISLDLSSWNLSVLKSPSGKFWNIGHIQMNLSSMKTPSKSFGICLEDDLHLHHCGRLPQFCNTPQTTVEALGDLSCQVSCDKPPVKGEEPIGSERILALGVPGSFKTKLFFFLKKLSRCIEYPPWNYI